MDLRRDDELAERSQPYQEAIAETFAGTARELLMSASIARYLKDFGESQPSVASFSEAEMPDVSFGDFSDDFSAAPEVETVDVESERRSAYADGHETATRELNEKMDAERTDLLAKHAAEIAELTAKYQVETAAFVATRLRESTDALAVCLSEQVATLLAPVLTEELSARAATSLADLVRAAIPDGEAATLVVKGPRSLFESLKVELSMDEKLIQFTETADIDLSVEIGETVLVTRMSAWASSLRKVLK